MAYAAIESVLLFGPHIEFECLTLEFGAIEYADRTRSLVLAAEYSAARSFAPDAGEYTAIGLLVDELFQLLFELPVFRLHFVETANPHNLIFVRFFYAPPSLSFAFAFAFAETLHRSTL